LYGGRTSPELRSPFKRVLAAGGWRPLRGYEPTPLATGTSMGMGMGTIFANRAHAGRRRRAQGLWHSLELENNDFVFFSIFFPYSF
jgi:hypothetical protein